jgi:hypothetical protein
VELIVLEGDAFLMMASFVRVRFETNFWGFVLCFEGDAGKAGEGYPGAGLRGGRSEGEGLEKGRAPIRRGVWEWGRVQGWGEVGKWLDLWGKKCGWGWEGGEG